MADSDSEDEFPNDFDGLDLSNVPGLQPTTFRIDTPEPPGPLAGHQHLVPTIGSGSRGSSSSPDISDVDSSFLAAVDELEARALHDWPRATPPRNLQLPTPVAPGPSNATNNATKTMNAVPTYRTDKTSSVEKVRKRSIHSPEASPTKKKGKMKAEPQEDIQTMLGAYEAELTCPICCDIFVGAHVSNPCGHTCCGECGHMWLARNKSAPTCAICRSSLSDIKPLLPNFAVDNLVRQHLQALASSGQSDWQNKGGKLVSWNNRLESWKKRAAVTRAAEVKAKEPARQYRLRSHHYRAEEYLHYHIPPWVVDRGIIEDEEED